MSNESITYMYELMKTQIVPRPKQDDAMMGAQTEMDVDGSELGLESFLERQYLATAMRL